MRRARMKIDRRGFLQAGGALLVNALCGGADARRAAPAAGPAKGPGRSCIVLWLGGGPSHIDTFDPKPGRETGGPFAAIPTAVPGLSLSEHLPQLAAEAGHLAVVRSLSSKEGNHERAAHLLRTGYAPSPTVDYPALGSWASAELGDPKAALPAFVSVRGPSAGAGCLGAQHGPFVVQTPGQAPENTDYPRAVDSVRFLRRQAALRALEEDFARRTGDPKIAARQKVRERAVRMMYTPRLDAFDLSGEPEALRRAYGDHDFGRGCLLARRLVEAGVRFVEVALDGWDTHKDNFGQTRRLSGILDGAMAALMRDLRERGAWDRTVVLCMGEFGRTPRINADQGRDHHPQAFSVLLCGGGVRGGQAYGATDADGAKVVDRPVSVPDLLATVAVLVGMDPDREIQSQAGRPVGLTDHGTPVAGLLA